MTRGYRLTGWRRIADAMWSNPDDPQIYGDLDVDAEPAIAFIQRARRAGHRVTPTHLVGRAIAHALSEVPALDVRIRRGNARPRETVDVFFITAVTAGDNLSGVKIVNVAAKAATEVAVELAHKSHMLKTGRDAEFSRTKWVAEHLPRRLLRGVLRATAFMTQDLRLDVPQLALRRDPFGSAMVSSVGMFGLTRGFIPIAWMYDVPLLVLVGEIADRPAVIDGRVGVKRMIPITPTIDHRYVDGWQVSKAMAAFCEYLAAPDRFEPAFLITNPATDDRSATAEPLA